ncbi:MAG: right-handed parallel beta-helix repeat-containing protein, partial [Rudaea sp.]
MNFPLPALALAAIAACASPDALATDYYLSDCQAGAAASCVAGSPTNDGLSAARPKRLASQLPPLQGDDRVLYARGGAWIDAGMGIYIPTASANHPVTWQDYIPPWGSSAKPILIESRSGRYLFNISDGGIKAADGGYVVSNLDLRGGGKGGGEAAIFLYYAVNDVVMENLDISGFNVGVYAAHNPDVSGGWENYRVTLRNSHIHGNVSFGWLGGAETLLIENNSFDHNGTRIMFDHDVYLSTVTNGIVRGNSMSYSVLNASGQCSGSVIVAHGAVKGLTIANNKILQQASVAQCYGIELSGGYDATLPGEYFHDVLISSNTIVNVGYVGIGLRGCTRCVVEDNQLVWTGGGGSQGISMYVNNPGSNDELGTALTIRSNSIFMQDASGSPGIIRLLNEGTGHTITSNLIYMGSSTAPSALCFDPSTYTIAQLKAFDNNLCFRAGGASYSSAFATLQAATQAGFDV